MRNWTCSGRAEFNFRVSAFITQKCFDLDKLHHSAITEIRLNSNVISNYVHLHRTIKKRMMIAYLLGKEKHEAARVISAVHSVRGIHDSWKSRVCGSRISTRRASTSRVIAVPLTLFRFAYRQFHVLGRATGTYGRGSDTRGRYRGRHVDLCTAQYDERSRARTHPGDDRRATAVHADSPSGFRDTRPRPINMHAS